MAVERPVFLLTYVIVYLVRKQKIVRTFTASCLFLLQNAKFWELLFTDIFEQIGSEKWTWTVY